jgi:hypothetical protein
MRAHAEDSLLTFVKTPDNATVSEMFLRSDTIIDYGLNLFDNGAKPFNYVAVELDIQQGGKYFFGQKEGNMDTVMLLYKGSFNPNSVKTNLVAANDDWYRFNNSDLSTTYGTKTPADKCSGDYSCIKLDNKTTLELSKCGLFTKYCPGMYANLDSNTKYYMIVTHFRSTEAAQFTLPQTFWCYGATCELKQTQIDTVPRQTQEPATDNQPKQDPAPAPAPTQDPAKDVVQDPVPTKKAAAESVATFLSLITQERSLAQLMSREASRLVGAVENDCAAFNPQGYCSSFRTRATTGSSISEGAGVFILSRRASDRIRVGAFVDYVVTSQEPSGLQLKDQRPTFGGFVGYAQRETHLGYHAKLSVAYTSGRLISTRESILESEQGSGIANLRSYAARGEVAYSFAYQSWVMTPFLAARHVQVVRQRYVETFVVGSVESPLSLAESRLNLTSAITGLRVEGRFTAGLGYQISVAGEYDVLRRMSSMRGTSEIEKLEFFGIQRSFNKDPLRISAMTGVFWEFAKNSRLFAQTAVRGNPRGVGSVTTLAGYQIAF